MMVSDCQTLAIAMKASTVEESFSRLRKEKEKERKASSMKIEGLYTMGREIYR